jgi:hypothetical protein
MKMYRLEAQIQAFLTTALNGYAVSLQASARLLPVFIE